ncbi:substrate-binding domain-containing protein [Dyella mobilis]|uniref:Extracellular solute-binding protein n=1 Tax=Dyella mobilis TaxID=1849582 RepID=A0ABS2KD72_9GAMM|nr:substrate-binding domain-containing protein [Dyella mobilis]MBM7128990.1 extracellular solute-binding protein [Dyella mobilis]GLQ99316.1 ABC transporter substrate-binding protein [Dyella mobilis]
MFKSLFFACLIVAVSPCAANAADVLHVYGPGGPAPAMREAAKAFGKAHGIQVEVTAGPTGKWAADFQKNGDIIYSGSENMMSGFLAKFTDTIDPATVNPLYIRPAGILVRPGNPKHIEGFEDLLKPGMQVMVVEGAGQIGMWEDIAGASGDVATIRTFRTHITRFAPNSAEALKAWQTQPSFDAWIIFPIWALAHPGVADVVPLSPPYLVYRDSGVALTHRGEQQANARAFLEFLSGPEGRRIFVKYGWTDQAAAN